MTEEPVLARYAHRAKPYAGEATFTLYADRIAIHQGRRKGDFFLKDIVMIRLMYKPKNTTSEGYQTKLYRRDRKTASFTNLTWMSLVQLDRQDEDYRRFVEQVITAVHRANPSVVLVQGMPKWLHILTGSVGLGSVIALLTVATMAGAQGGWPMAALTAALAVYFIWWAWRYVGKNIPASFSAKALPADVMPPLT